MAHITAAGNVEVPAYLTLIEKGYEVQWDGGEYWTARKGENVFGGDGPIEVLGIVCMYENRGEDWKASDKAIDEFLERYPQ